MRPRAVRQAAATRLSELRDNQRAAGEPGLVICGTANINAVREVPPGQGGFCVTFDADHVTLHREKGLAAERPGLTSDYEALIGHRRSTLFDVSAISGAAVSPLMGSATRQAYRILFTATNVRLGVWLPHPAVVRDARQLIDHPQDYAAHRRWERHPLLLLLWYLSPHLLWDHDPDTSTNREARLWAHVLQLRLDGKRSARSGTGSCSPLSGCCGREAAGRLSYRATWMYVTDGGHYDNLGLVEALRRGASNIVVLDASGDKADTWFTLGGAIALARADAGVEIELDPTTMFPGGRDLAPGQVVRPWAHWPVPPAAGPAGGAARRQGDIWVCKLGWWTGAPWDVQAYAGAIRPTHRQHAGAAVRRRRVRGVPAARRGHGPGRRQALRASAHVGGRASSDTAPPVAPPAPAAAPGAAPETTTHPVVGAGGRSPAMAEAGADRLCVREEDPMRVYEAIVKGLEGIGVTAAFGGAGENAAGLMIALKHSERIRPVITRHEQAASFMACGYAMYTDRLGVCFATAGPGAFNLFSGLAVAMSDSYPVLAISGYSSLRWAGTRVSQRDLGDQPDTGLAGHVHGHHKEVLPAHRHRRHLRRARGSGAPGVRRAPRPGAHPRAGEPHRARDGGARTTATSSSTCRRSCRIQHASTRSRPFWRTPS